MAYSSAFLQTKDNVDLTPMIDVVFLLLAFFMVTTNLTQEADLGITLPAPPIEEIFDLPPEEHIVEIAPSGQIRLNGAVLDDYASADLPQLTHTLERLRKSTESVGRKVSITIAADPDSMHERSIAVLNACAAAKVKLVMFSAE